MQTSNVKPVRVGLVGYGWWGKIIAKQISNSNILKLIAVVEVDQSLLPQMESDVGLSGVKVLSNYEEFLKISEMEAVILCTPHLQHADQIINAAHAGKHVFCEKPPGRNVEDVLKVIDCEEKYPNLKMKVQHVKHETPEIPKNTFTKSEKEKPMATKKSEPQGNDMKLKNLLPKDLDKKIKKVYLLNILH